MRFAILSDVHGNLLALQAVLAEIDALGGADAVLVLGDHLTAGPHPCETYDLLQERGCHMLRGNNDDYVIDGLTESWPAERNASIQWAPLRWTLDHTTPEMLAGLVAMPNALWLDPLRQEITPWRQSGESLGVAVHGTLASNRDCVIPDLPDVLSFYRHAMMFESDYRLPDAAQVHDASGAQLYLCGHTHIPWMLERGQKLALNPGAVSGSIHGDPRARYALVEWRDGRWNADMRAVEWDLAGYARACRETGFQEAGGPLAWGFILNVLTGDNVGYKLILHLKAWRKANGLEPDTPIDDRVWLQAAQAFEFTPWERMVADVLV